MSLATSTYWNQIQTQEELEDAFDELESAEDFLEFFQIDYLPGIVLVNRLHILQRFHNLLNKQGALPESIGDNLSIQRSLLQQAYESFIDSSAQKEKVLKVFNRAAPGTGFVSLTAISTNGG